MNLDDKGVLVYKEVGNTYTSSHNYFVSNSNEVEFIIGGKRHTVLATGQVHTHPSWNPTQTENPLGISGADINSANIHFDGIINILLVRPNETIIQCLGKWKWTGFSRTEKMVSFFIIF